MKILVDGRVLKHEKITGVDNHAINIIKFLEKEIDIEIAQPRFQNKYYTHLWEHLFLPLQSIKYDILYCPSNIAPIFLPKKVKLVLTLHDLSFKDFPQMYSNIFKKYYEFLIPKVVTRADKVVTISQFSYERILKEYPFLEEKLAYVYHGKNSIFFYDVDVRKKDYILYVGSLNDTKNFSAVLKSYAKLGEISTSLVMVAPDSSNFALTDENRELLENAKKNPKIEIISYMEQKKLLKIYQEAKLFLFPSLHESFGFPVLEAMACGTPVVCSQITSLPEIGMDGVVYCNPKDIDDICEKVTMVLENSNLQNCMIEKSVKIASKFQWENSAKEYVKIIEKVVI